MQWHGALSTYQLHPPEIYACENPDGRRKRFVHSSANVTVCWHKAQYSKKWFQTNELRGRCLLYTSDAADE